MLRTRINLCEFFLETAQRALRMAINAKTNGDIASLRFGSVQSYFALIKAIEVLDEEVSDSITRSVIRFREKYINSYPCIIPVDYYKSIHKALDIYLRDAYACPDYCPVWRDNLLLQDARIFYQRILEMVERRKNNPEKWKELYITSDSASDLDIISLDNMDIGIVDGIVSSIYFRAKSITREEALSKDKRLIRVHRYYNDGKLGDYSLDELDVLDDASEARIQLRTDESLNGSPLFLYTDGSNSGMSETYILLDDYQLPENEGIFAIRTGCSGIYGAENVRSISIPEGVIELCSQAFYGCQFLEEVHLPSTLRRIESNAFGNCPALRKINLPEILEDCGSPFSNCIGLMNENGMIVLGNRLFYVSHSHIQNDVLVVPDGITEIYSGAIAYGSSVKVIYLPSSIQKINSHAIDFLNPEICIFFPENIRYQQLYRIIREVDITDLPLKTAIASLNMRPKGKYSLQLAVGYAVAWFLGNWASQDIHDSYVTFFREHKEEILKWEGCKNEINTFYASGCEASHPGGCVRIIG